MYSQGLGIDGIHGTAGHCLCTVKGSQTLSVENIYEGVRVSVSYKTTVGSIFYIRKWALNPVLLK